MIRMLRWCKSGKALICSMQYPLQIYYMWPEIEEVGLQLTYIQVFKTLGNVQDRPKHVESVLNVGGCS